MRLVLLLVTAAALAAAGCDSNKGGEATGEAADLPVPADFEEEAEKAITSDNYKDELATLEKEIDAP